MKHLFIVFAIIYCCSCVKEDLPDLADLLDDPNALYKLEKRLGSLLEELDKDGKSSTPPPRPRPVGCSALQGVLKGPLERDCAFTVKTRMIIKTTESLKRGAKFLENVPNITCARDCTQMCCDNPQCDTSVYQDKEDHNCYLFQCNSPSACVFADHANYSRSSLSNAVHRSHSVVPGGATTVHENELQNLGSDNTGPKQEPTYAPTTKKTPLARPGRPCEEDEFRCMTRGECIPKAYICDGNSDCSDGSDEEDCVDEDKPDDRVSDTRPHNTKPKVTDDNSIQESGRPRATEAPKKQPAPVTAAPTAAPPPKKIPVTTTKIVPAAPVVSDQSSESEDTDSEETQASNDQDDTDSDSRETSENQSADKPTASQAQSISNQSNAGGNGQFKFLNVESVEVDSYSDNSQGPIVALSLGLAITVMLLIFVGCRLRTVKRRLRKGRALHSNEADYLINGMYL